LLENDGGKPLKKVEDKVKTYKVKPKGGVPKVYAGLFVSEGAAAKVLAQLFWLNPGSNISDFICTGDCARVSKSFIPAINRLRAFAIDKGSAASEFPQQAAAWRALASKPPLPEEVRAQRLLAENALKEKQLVKAMIHYEAGLKLYPTWPQGWFNAAMIAAELGSYAEAVERMQAYLELVPDASDAQAARDQIVIWRDKAGQQQPVQGK
jgi:tetratricopeptide (TPR) repeat protein